MTIIDTPRGPKNLNNMLHWTEHGPGLLEALEAISRIETPATGDNRGPLKYARHIAKCAMKIEGEGSAHEHP